MYVIHEPTVPVALDKVCFGYRKIPVSRRGHVVGWHPVRRGHAQVPFESRLERDVITWAAALPGFRRIQAQPFTLWLPDDSSAVRYTPDFYIEFSCIVSRNLHCGLPPTNSFLVEAKYDGDWQQHKQQLRPKLIAACQVLSIPLIVLTEYDVRAAGGYGHE